MTIINLIAWCVFGLFAGAIARLLTPGSDAIGCLGTIAVGVIGSVVGGFLGNLLMGGEPDNFAPAGLIGAVLGSILVLLVLRMLSPRRPVA